MQKKLDNEELIFFYKNIGKNVAKYRKMNKISQMELANKLGYKSVSSISQPELFYNKCHFSLRQLYLISKVLNISLSLLVDENNQNKIP